MKKYKLKLKMLNSGVTVDRLPKSWKILNDLNFYPDLLEISKRYLAQSEKLGLFKEASVFLEQIGEGFLRKFDSKLFRPDSSDPDALVKNKILDALDELSNEFDDRISSVVWDSFAHLATRNDIHKERSILDESNSLPHPWYVVDSVLHSVAKAYAFKLHIDSIIFKHAKVVVMHGCGCSCSLQKVESNGYIEMLLKKSRFKKSTFEVLSHLTSESLLIMGLQMPFAMGFSDDAQQVLMEDGFMSKIPQEKKIWRFSKIEV